MRSIPPLYLRFRSLACKSNVGFVFEDGLPFNINRLSQCGVPPNDFLGEFVKEKTSVRVKRVSNNNNRSLADWMELTQASIDYYNWICPKAILTNSC